ncbi:MAG: ABC transporter substrate-binding protein [Opitutaceae bacterium]|nr:ABC transporter substrate-binding protein [Opitutaceae bacterium]
MVILTSTRRVFAAFAIWLFLSLVATAGNRVVSQTVGTDELLLAIAATEEVAALSHLSTNLEFSGIAGAASRYPRLVANADSEGILRHSPTLVLFADYSRIDLRTQVERSGVKIIVFDRYATLEDSFENLRILGRAMGPQALQNAEEVIARSRARVETLALRLAGVRPVSVIAPSTYGLIPGDKTTFQDICEHSGADNLAYSEGQLTGHAPQPTEAMLAWRVEKIVVAGSSLESAVAPLLELAPYRFMPAVREKNAALLEPWHMSCVSHMRVEAYEHLARQLHPSRFK